MRLFFSMVLLVIASGTSSAAAQNADRWTRLDPAKGLGVGVCSTSDRQTCIYVRCGAGRGLEFTVRSSTRILSNQNSVKIEVDQSQMHELAWGASELGSVMIDAPSEFRLLNALQSGNTATLVTRGKSYPLSLRGSSKSIDYAIKNCSALAERSRSGVSSFGDAFERRADEATMSFPPEKTDWSYKRYKNTDFWGGDIRHGIDDALLRAMTVGECEALCSITKGCVAYTHNGNENVCFLKSGVEKVKSFQKATSGELIGERYNLPPPPTNGPGLVLDPNLSWRDGDTREGWYRRLRDASRPLGASCDAERTVVQELAENIQFSLKKDVNKIGDFATVHWTGNNLIDRVPVWIILSSKDPVRFSGEGSFALGPGAPNPFNVEYKNNTTRNVVALFSRGAGESGEVDIYPLLAGASELNFAVVAYLRRCEDEVAIAKGATSFDLEPNDPEIVLNSEVGLAALTNRVKIPEFDREILFDENRFLIRSMDQQTEILVAAGSELSISPTHRFVVVKHLGKFQFFDIYDGKIVGEQTYGDLFWFLNDTFVMSTTAPWGQVNLMSLFGDGTSVNRLETGPSCCAADGHTRVGIDIENAMVTVWKGGHHVGSLQNSRYYLSSDNGRSFGDEGHTARYAKMLESAGPVSPISMVTAFNTVDGAIPTVKGYYGSAAVDNTTEANLDRIQETRLSDVGLSIDRAAQPKMWKIDHGLFSASSVSNNLERMKVALSSSKSSKELLKAPIGNIYEMIDPETGEYLRSAFDRVNRASFLTNQLKENLEKYGVLVGWPDFPDYYSDSVLTECDHIISEDAHVAGLRTLINNDVVEIERVSDSDSEVWLLRTSCEAGATFGTLRGQSALAIVDTSRAASLRSKGSVVASDGYLQNNRTISYFEHDFEAKATQRFVIGYAPKNGVIWLFDRDKRKMTYIGENLPNGDLLQNAWLTKDEEHLVQLNSDGSIYFHRVVDGKTILNGRIADDEIAVWTDDFRFDATAEAASAIELRFPGIEGHFSLDRFDNLRRTPNLATRVLSGDIPPLLNSDLPVPPEIDGSIEYAAGQIKIVGALTKGDAQDVQVFQDGVLTDTIASFDKSGGFKADIARLKDSRWISVVARDSSHIESLPMTKDLGISQTQKSVQRALVIGVDRYTSPVLQNLNYAKSDAGRIYRALRDGMSAPTKLESVVGLSDRNASPEAIVAEVEKLLRGLSKGDHAVVFFAGHGLQDSDGRFYLGTPDADIGDLGGTALPWSRLSDLLSNTEARITVFLDACHAGAVSSGAFATNDAAVGSIVSVASNITILAASKGREFSQESGKRQGGLFSVALENLLINRGEFDENGNGSIEASELYRGIKSQVVAFEGANQTPWMVKNKMVGDYAIF